MKKIIYILSFLVFACNSEDANDCFQTAGDIITQELDLGNFDRILVAFSKRDLNLGKHYPPFL